MLGLIVLSLDFEISLRMGAYRTELRSFLADNDVSAV